MLASRMWLPPPRLLPSLCPQQQPGPSLPSCIPAVYLLGGFLGCVCDDHPGPTFRPDRLPATPNIPGSLLPPHPAHILAQRLPPPFLLCLSSHSFFLLERAGARDLHGPVRAGVTQTPQAPSPTGRREQPESWDEGLVSGLTAGKEEFPPLCSPPYRCCAAA